MCRKPLIESFNEIRSKITLICGDQDPLEKRDVIRRAAVSFAQLGTGHVEILHGCGSAPHLEEPDQFCQALSKSLREKE